MKRIVDFFGKKKFVPPGDCLHGSISFLAMTRQTKRRAELSFMGYGNEAGIIIQLLLLFQLSSHLEHLEPPQQQLPLQPPRLEFPLEDGQKR